MLLSGRFELQFSPPPPSLCLSFTLLEIRGACSSRGLAFHDRIALFPGKCYSMINYSYEVAIDIYIWIIVIYLGSEVRRFNVWFVPKDYHYQTILDLEK